MFTLNTIKLNQVKFIASKTPIFAEEHLVHAWDALRDMATDISLAMDEEKYNKTDVYFKNRIGCVKALTSDKKILADVALLEEEYSHI